MSVGESEAVAARLRQAAEILNAQGANPFQAGPH